MELQKPSTVSTLLSGSSKKIKKSSSSKKYSESLSSPSSSSGSSKYATYSKDLKRRVLTDLKKAFLTEFQYTFTDEEEIQEDQLLCAIEDASIKEFDKYNKVLKTILKRKVEDFVDTTANMTSWRKKIKSWIQGIEKPETRGGLVIPNEKKDEFKAGLTVILQNLPYRNLELLRERIFELLERLFEGKPFDRSTCSKHWWFNYQKRNPEISKLWKSLLLERTVKKGTIKASKKKPTRDETSSSLTEVSSPVDDSEMLVEEIHSTSTNLPSSNFNVDDSTDQSPMEYPLIPTFQIPEMNFEPDMFFNFGYEAMPESQLGTFSPKLSFFGENSNEPESFRNLFNKGDFDIPEFSLDRF